MVPTSSRIGIDRIKGHEHKLQHGNFEEVQGNVFYCDTGQILEQVMRRRSGICNLHPCVYSKLTGLGPVLSSDWTG